MKNLLKSKPLIAALALASLLAPTAHGESLDIGLGMGIPSGGQVPINLNATMPVFSVSSDASLAVRADVTTSFSTAPALGVSGLFTYRANALGMSIEPFAGVGVSTVSYVDRMGVMPVGVFGATVMPGSFGVRVNGFVAYAADAVQFGAGLNLVFRIGWGGQ